MADRTPTRTGAAAQVLTVSAQRPSSYPSIGEALSAAQDGAVISVAPGTYAEALQVNGIGISIIAAEGPGTVVIDASPLPYPAILCNGGRVEARDLVLRSGEPPVVAVDHGHLRMDRSQLDPDLGPGVRATNRSRIELTRVTVDGGQNGFVIEDSDGTVEDCEIRNAVADGIIVRHGAGPELRACTVRDCGERGVYVYQFGRPTLEGCTIANVGGAGVAVAHGSTATVLRCRIERTRGPGIAFGRGCGGAVKDCTFALAAGGEVEVAEGAHPVLGPREAPAAAAEPGHDDEVARLLAELDAMIGLAGVKREVRALIDEIQVNQWRRASGLSVSNLSHHLIFAGPPGTGKTTVARVYGKLLAALRVLPKGGFVEVTRQELVVGYLGQTAEQTARVFREALGGVLFIDEAHTLARTIGSGRDFGQEAIDTLVKLMEDHRTEIAVIAAGYSEDMVTFLEVNPGLASRFARTIEFESYSAEQLVSLSHHIAKAADYVLDASVDAALSRHFATIERDPSFGNAREVRRLFDAIRTAQAQRLSRLGHRPGLDDLRTITERDVLVAVGAA
jgi:Holliday junction resolvasome RuvABC ATP-dependent DNA helicase subunit